MPNISIIQHYSVSSMYTDYKHTNTHKIGVLRVHTITHLKSFSKLMNKNMVLFDKFLIRQVPWKMYGDWLK